MTSRGAPSEEARARLRDEAKALDVEDIVDLCCAQKVHDAVRVAIYLEALRGKVGEKAQLGALLLCFDLARHGDERCANEVELLLPVVDVLVAEPRGVVSALTDKSDDVAKLWTSLVAHAAQRDKRQATAAPVAEVEAIELEIFDAIDIEELSATIEDLVVVDAEAQDEFDRSFDSLWPPGAPLFSADTRDELARLEKLQEVSRSFSSAVPLAAELQAMSALFLAAHTRALGLFGRRNKQRDALLKEALTTFANLREPPSRTAAWFIAGGDVPGSVPHAWEKMAEVLLDFAGHVGREAEEEEEGAEAKASSFDASVARYLKEPRSASVPQVLLTGNRRRR